MHGPHELKRKKQADRTQRFEPATVWYDLWYVRDFPLAAIDQRRAWRNPHEIPWIWGLLEDIRESGTLRNPILVWNHHDTPFLPRFCARHGGNRIWCVQRLGWETVPITLSARPRDSVTTALLEGLDASRIPPADLPAYFPDGGDVWANAYGYGLYDPKLPEVTYAASAANHRATPAT